MVVNALEHGAGESPVKITARGEPDEIVIAVHNQGPVIPAKDLAQLFEAMKHMRGEGASDRRHLGLDLYIVDKIVTAHGGSIDVRSSTEAGTTFSLRLPRRE